MDASNSPRSRGRPRVPDKARKRNNVTIRMRDELKSKIEQNATAHQRSISEEIETRLERSFVEETAFGGPEMRRMAYLMGSAFAVAGQHSAAGEPDWLDEPAHYAAAGAGVIDALLIGRADEPLLIEGWLSRLLTRKAWLKEQAK
jgi:Arc-like DNA binding domain